MSSLINEDILVECSSVLDDDYNSYGPSLMFDGREDTCWNSDGGENQFLVIEFPSIVDIHSISLVFQGGFVGRQGKLLIANDDDADWRCVLDFEPEDVNDKQDFVLPENSGDKVRLLRIEFTGSSDFYGRVTIYNLDVIGTISN